MSVADWSRRWSRVKEAGWDELQTRAVQEISKRWDASIFPRLAAQRAVSVAPAPGGRFFFSPEQRPAILALLRQRLPGSVEAILRRAEDICRHRFDLLGYRGLDHGESIDWHLDAVSGKRSPRIPFYKVPYLSFRDVGDVKVTWELNRHQHLVTLAKAYCFTGEKRFVAELVRQWYDWQQHNPYPVGVNWSSSLEVAFRSLSWLWVRHLLAEDPVFDQKFGADLHAGLLLHGRHIERYLSTYFSPNTHLLGEAVALFFLGTLCGSDHSARWKRRGWEITLEQSRRQVQPDGLHFEQSTYYHVYALDFFLHARLLAERNGTEIPAELDETLRRMLRVLQALGQGGSPPRFGDDDGGRLFDGSRNRPEHLLDPLAAGAVLFNDPGWKTANLELTEEAIWLLGADAAARFDALPAVAAKAESAVLRGSGLCVMTADAAPRPRLVFDAGNQGADGAGHGHADALSVQLAIAGHEVLSDPGTFMYISGGPERAEFRSTLAHNTLAVDGADQSQAAGPFAWRTLPTVRLEESVLGHDFDWLVGSHTGYQRLAEPVLHRRRVFFRKPDLWLVFDEAEGKGPHRLELSWHLAPGLQWDLHNGAATAMGKTAGVAVIGADDPGWSRAVRDSWHSEVYGRRVPSQDLRFHCQASLPATFATVLRAISSPLADPGVLVRLHQGSADVTVRVFAYSREGEKHRMFLPSAAGSWHWGMLASDARFLYYSETGENGQQLFFCGGSYVTVDGQVVVQCSHPVDRLEVTVEEGGTRFACSDPAGPDLRLERLSRLRQVIEDTGA